MRSLKRVLTLCFWVAFAAASHAWAQSSATGPHINVSLVSEYQQLHSGQNWLGLYLQPDPEWHTYWRNPGDSGEAPVMEWHVPEKVTTGDIQWPIPKAIQVAHLVNYGYEGANLLMVPVNIPDEVFVEGQEITLALDTSWLVCKEDCIPGWASLRLTLPMSDTPSVSAYSDLFAATRATLPNPTRLTARHEINDSHLVVSLKQPAQADWQLLPFDSNVVQHNQIQQRLVNNNQVTLLLPKSDYFVASQADIQFLLTDGQQGYYLSSAFNGAPPSSNTGLITLMLMALAGGLILNLMPCVLPVLSIKALSISQGSANGKSVALAYSLGVILSFNGFAVLIMLLKQSGDAVGWGFHMQSPWVVAALAYLFVFIGLSMLDLVSVGNRLSGVGQDWIKDNGRFSHFLTGVLAVLVASPCTAPFMAAALGVAMVSDSLTSFAIFNALAVGFALPMALLSWSPALQRWLPKPGNWLVTFRQFLAFPMFATVIWLVWVYVNQTSTLSQAMLLSGLLLFAMFIWLSNKVSALSVRTVLMLCILASIGLPISSYQSAPDTAQNQSIVDAFSPQKLAALRAREQVVLVNMTADWCITCKVNEQVAFQSPELQTMLARQDIHYLVGDWTNRNTVILDFLTQYQRAGVPLYVVYAGSGSEQILPQILTVDTVVDALNSALGETQP